VSDLPPAFDDRFRQQLRRLLAWRRDVRRFRPDPIPSETLAGLIAVACSAPSVGLSQPWRFVVVDDPVRRRLILDEFRRCNAAALQSYADAVASHYARLKLAGLAEAPCQLAVFADRTTEQGRSLGRATMPETADYSAVAAIMTMWLMARAEGIGIGWVSILSPARVSAVLAVPAEWRFIAYLCIGYPAGCSATPELEREGWENRRAPGEFIFRR
jgi:5,6-dimethylbenzimidazole synthase